MITQFKLFESNSEININLPENTLNQLIDLMSLIIYKGSKRDSLKHKNYKSLRIKSISGYYNHNDLKNKEMTNDCLLQIEMTNKDKIEAKYTRKSDLNNLIENSVYIEINGEPQYHLDNENFTIDSLINMVSTYYKKYIENKKWKIK
jgi:hypothetical protein